MLENDNQFFKAKLGQSNENITNFLKEMKNILSMHEINSNFKEEFDLNEILRNADTNDFVKKGQNLSDLQKILEEKRNP